MKLCKIIVKGFRRFDDVQFDLTYPEGHPLAGEPLDKVCLTGLNGTGKSTLLEILRSALSNVVGYRDIPLLILKLKFGEQRLYTVHAEQMPKVLMFKESIEQEENWVEKLISTFNNAENFTLQQYLYSRYLLQGHSYNELVQALPLKNSHGDLLIHAPAELSAASNPDEVISSVTLRHAEHLFKEMPFFHSVAESTLANFWQQLIFQSRRRENLFKEFLELPDNQEVKIKKLRSDFEQNNPQFLQKLGERWNEILQPLGLLFIADAPAPIQPCDGLLPRICFAQNERPIDYSMLSGGLRRLLFTLGHIYALFYGNKVQRAFVLLDGLDCNVHPHLIKKAFDMLLCISDAQLLVTAHTPTLQQCFEPFERIELGFTPDGFIRKM
ncbi:MAG: AAA family ATPase [Prevotellaceae bacterium]|jgi:energy-coupling factor transporter ATP-binding protein EcfA2|nr:AAA family ATPase [Prevotellaceae bacterium]